MSNFSLLSQGRVSEQGRVGNTAWFEINDPAISNGAVFVRATDSSSGICPLGRVDGTQRFLVQGPANSVDLDYVVLSSGAGSVSDSGESVLQDGSGDYINPVALSESPYRAHSVAANYFHHSTFEGKFWREHGQRHVYMSGAFFWVDSADNRLMIEHRIFYFNPMSPVVPFPPAVFEGATLASRDTRLSFDDRCVLTSVTQ